MDNGTCPLAENGRVCGLPVRARGWCSKHYQRWQKYGDVSVVKVGRRKPVSPECLVCGGPVKARGYCSEHYWKWWKWGDPNFAAPEHEHRTCSECEQPARALGYCTKHWRRFHKHGDPSVVGKRTIDQAARKYSLNHRYFAEVSTPEQAYWLGFIAADGTVSADPRNSYLGIELSRVDTGHLLKFARAIESDAPLRETRQNCVRIRVHSQRLVEDLAALGIIERKSLVVVPPLEKLAGLEQYYWRGLWDGDGTISTRRDRRAGWDIGVVGSFACVDGFGAWGRGISGCTAVPGNSSSANPDFWQWHLKGTRKPRLLAEQLRLAGIGFGLDRKQVLLEAACTFDLGEHEVRWRTARGELMREIWAAGRHPRAKRA